MQDYWHKQTADKPLFPDLLWSRPENKRQAGKLLIVGGNAHGFAAAGEAYAEAAKAGIGTARVLLPDSLQKTVGKVFVAGEYAPSTPSGSFSQQALAELLGMAAWSDGVLLAGDLGRNSETSILLEKLIAKYDGPLIITHDALDYFVKLPASLLERPRTVLVASFAQLQKLAGSVGYPKAFKFSMELLQLVETLHDFTKQYQPAVVMQHNGTAYVAVDGQVSTTPVTDEERVWRVRTAGHAAVWYLQNPGNTFGALTTSLIET